jgi:uncharacterized protein involved in response to NO
MTAISDAPAASHAFLSYAFRPFFLAAGTFAALAMLVWLPMFITGLELPIEMAPRDWHVHEMVYGYAAAAIAGFLFTAIPNWTGRPPVSGSALLVLLLVWIAGRLAMATSGLIGLRLAMLVDFLFLPLVAFMAGHEIVASGNRRNFKLLAVLALLIGGNAVFSAEVLYADVADYGQRFGLAAVVALIIVIGGRIVPNFTRNALMQLGRGRLPQPFGPFDIAAIVLSVAALATWVVVPQGPATAAVALLAGTLQAVRLARWAGDRARGDWLVLVLHVAYAFVPLGFLLIGITAFAPAGTMTGAGVHAWGVGAIGLMTLAVMTRATLGHTGRPLVASRATVIVYGLMIVAAVARIAAAFPLPASSGLLALAGVAWVTSFAGFVAIYGPMMLGPRLVSGPPGC